MIDTSCQCPLPRTAPLVVIVGPTASGKTALAVKLAQRLGGEVIGADSRQVYRAMDAGISKPSPAERSLVPHHLIDVVDPDEPFHLADYVRLATNAISDVRGRGHVPVLAGGSGQYVWAVVEGWEVPAVAPNLALRTDLTERARTLGPLALHAELRRVDPDTASAIHPHNVRRVIRALELHAESGRRPSELRARRRPRSDAVILGVRTERNELYRRIDRRVDEMVERGLIEEVERLLRCGYQPSLPSMSSIGYTQVVQMLRGELTRADAIVRVKTATHRLARQQSVWFRLDDPRITWLAPDDVDMALQVIDSWVSRYSSV